MDLKEYLSKEVKRIYKDEDEEFYSVHYYLDINNAPDLTYDEDLETLDFENFEWIKITDDKLVICAGGDWQEPLKLTIELIDGKLSVTNVEKGFESGLTEKDFHSILFNTTDIDEILE